jgi:hypothetical protein
MYWYDGPLATGWYTNINSLYSSFITTPKGTVLPATYFDGTDYTYVSFIPTYYYIY